MSTVFASNNKLDTMRASKTILSILALAGCAAPDTQITKLTPDLAVAPGEVDFGDVVPSYVLERSLQVVNAGRARLEITGIYMEGSGDASVATVDGFTIDLPDGDTAELNPNDSITVDISFAPEDLTSYGAELVIESNDVDEPEMRIALSGTGVVGPLPDIKLSTNAIDFGEVPPGSTDTQFIIVSNVGDGPLNILDLVQGGSGAFDVITSPVGQTIPAGSESTVLVTYTPDELMSGHTGSLSLVSDDSDEPEVSVDLRGGDGSSYEYPVAVIDGPTEVHPPELVTLDGTESTDPEDIDDEYDLSYAWSVANRPDGSNARFLDSTAPVADLDIDVAGTYMVQLVVTDFNGVPSAPTNLTIEAVPVQDLYIALSWDKPYSDVDLHVVPTGGTFFSSEDASFCNTSPDWGGDGTAEHSGDASEGYGPETVEISDLSETDYYIGVHYFEDDGGSIVTASITIHVDGEPHETVDALMIHNDFWNVGYIRVIDGVGMFVESDESIDASSTRECDAG
jgi:hypothetical protein